MRSSTFAAAAAVLASSVSAQSICDKYTTALLNDNTAANQYALVTLLVKTAALGNFTGPGSANPTLPGSVIDTPGFLAPGNYMGEDVNLLPYFDGTFLSTNRGGDSGVSVNFLDGGSPSDPLAFAESEDSNQYTLISNLVSYFGVLLGCSMYGEDGFPTYAGSNSQYQVHKFMDLSEAEHSYFIVGVGASAQSFGASMEDINAAAMALNSTFGYRCAPPAMVVPDTDAELQVICGGSSCPLSPNATCDGDATVPMFTAVPPASTMLAPYPTASSGSMTNLPTGSGGMTGLPTPSAITNGASQKKAAGLLAVVGMAAALL